MCLAVPGKVVEVREDNTAGRLGSVDFQGSRVEVSLELVPDADLGSWVLVHAGFAITQLDEAEARETWEYLSAADLVEEIPEEMK